MHRLFLGQVSARPSTGFLSTSRRITAIYRRVKRNKTDKRTGIATREVSIDWMRMTIFNVFLRLGRLCGPRVEMTVCGRRRCGPSVEMTICRPGGFQSNVRKTSRSNKEFANLLNYLGPL
jgi:hypothetical protein